MASSGVFATAQMPAPTTNAVLSRTRKTFLTDQLMTRSSMISCSRDPGGLLVLGWDAVPPVILGTRLIGVALMGIGVAGAGRRLHPASSPHSAGAPRA